MTKILRSTGRKFALLAAAVAVVLSGPAIWLSWDEIQAHYLLWKEFEDVGPNAQGYREYRHRQTGILFVSLPGGEFLMGTSEQQAAWLAQEEPVLEDILSINILGMKIGAKEDYSRQMEREPGGGAAAGRLR